MFMRKPKPRTALETIEDLPTLFKYRLSWEDFISFYEGNGTGDFCELVPYYLNWMTGPASFGECDSYRIILTDLDNTKTPYATFESPAVTDKGIFDFQFIYGRMNRIVSSGIAPSNRFTAEEHAKAMLAKSYPLVLNLQCFVEDGRSDLRFGMLTSKTPTDREVMLSLVQQYLSDRSPEEPCILAVIHRGSNGAYAFSEAPLEEFENQEAILKELSRVTRGTSIAFIQRMKGIPHLYPRLKGDPVPEVIAIFTDNGFPIYPWFGIMQKILDHVFELRRFLPVK